MEIKSAFSEESLSALVKLERTIIELEEKTYNQLSMELQYHRSLSEKLGENGWTIHGGITPNDPREWLSIIESKGEAGIEEYYSERVVEEMLRTISTCYTKVPEKLYMERAIENYNSTRYTEATYFLLAVLNRQINQMVGQKLRKMTERCKIGIEERGRLKYEDLSKTPISRLFLFRDYLPSYKAFTIRLFIDGEEHDLDKGSEPAYLNRNWLMHGCMTRLVKRYECVQVINAIHTGIEMLDTMESLQ